MYVQYPSSGSMIVKDKLMEELEATLSKIKKPQ